MGLSCELLVLGCRLEALEGGNCSQLHIWQETHHKRPPESGFVRRKAPNIVAVCDCDAGRRVLHDVMF